MLNEIEIKDLTAKCYESKNTWMVEYFEAMAYTQPERNNIYRPKGGYAGLNKQIPLFTQAGKNGTDIFVARVQNKLFPYLKPYMAFTPKGSVEDSIVTELRDFCDVMSEKVNELKDEIELDNELNDSCYDLVCGTSLIMREDTINGISFTKIPFRDYALGAEKHQTVCRKFCMRAYKIGVVFPELFNLKVIDGVDINGPEKEKEIDLQDITYFDERRNVWEYYLLLKDKILLKRDYKKRPFYIFHWAKAVDMPYGTGVAIKALPALKRLNSFIKVNLELIPFAFPMFLTQSGNLMDKNVTFKPGGFINVANIQNIMPIQLSGAKNDFKLEIQSEELQIKQTFLDYTLPASPTQMTAAEVYARSNPQDEMVSLNVSRLTEVVKQIAWALFEDVFERELSGIVSFSLDEVKSLIECNINNEAMIDTVMIDKINGYVQSIGQFDPTAIWQGLNRSRTIEKYGEAFNLPIEMRRTSEEIDDIVEEQAEAEQMAYESQIEAQMAIDNNKENAIAQREIAKQEGEV